MAGISVSNYSQLAIGSGIGNAAAAATAMVQAI